MHLLSIFDDFLKQAARLDSQSLDSYGYDAMPANLPQGKCGWATKTREVGVVEVADEPPSALTT